MKISVEFSEKELKKILQSTEEKKMGPAVRKLALEALKLKTRRAWGEKILKGEWGVHFDKFVGKYQDRSSWSR